MDNGKELIVILAAFSDDNTLLSIFETIRHVERMDREQLLNAAENAFWTYICYHWIEEVDGKNLMCKMMYIREEERDKEWISLRNNPEKIFALHNRHMSKLFEYTKDSKVNMIYDND